VSTDSDYYELSNSITSHTTQSYGLRTVVRTSRTMYTYDRRKDTLTDYYTSLFRQINQ